MQNIALYGVVILALGVLFFVFTSPTPTADVVEERENIAQSSSSSSKDSVKIVYEEPKPQASTRDKEEQKSPQEERVKEEMEIAQSSSSSQIESHQASSIDAKATNIYTLIGSSKNTQNYNISLVSSQKIESKKGAPPTLPATIEGSIDGQSFRLVVPTNLLNSDLRLRVIDKESDILKEANIDISSLKPASVNILSMFFNDIENAHIITGDATRGDAPPMPPMF